MIEEHDEGGSSGVGAGDDDAEGVAVEPGTVGFEGVGRTGGGDEPRGDVRVRAVVRAGDAFAHLLVGPDKHGFPARGHPGNAEADSSKPRGGAEETKQGHAVLHQVNGEMAFARREHVEGLAEGELAHEVKGEVVEPGCHVHRCAKTLGYGRCKKRSVMVYLRFVFVESLGAEALIPNPAALVVKDLVAGGNDGGSREEEVVEGCLSALAAGAIDLSHCGGTAD